jgi:DNA polymerase-3 subunit delta'
MNIYIDQIIGNSKVKVILNKILESKTIPQAILFIGADGVGKENAAINFIKAINSQYNSPVNSDKKLEAINNFSEPYVKYIYPLPRYKNETDQHDPFERLSEDEIELITQELKKKSQNNYYKIQIPKANIIKINSIRDIKKFLSMDYDDVGFRTILISQAHLMNEEAQNSLLKNLEEPPEKVIFILCTPSPEKLKSTIISRCWTINFQPLDETDIISILINNFSIDKNIAEKVATFAGGSITEAILLIENDFEELLDKSIKILRNSFAGRFHSALVEFDDTLSENDQVRLKLIIRLLIIWLNDLQKYRIGKLEKIYYSSYLETLEKFNTKFPLVDVAPVVNELDTLSSYLKNNINPNIAVSNIVFKVYSLIPK